VAPAMARKSFAGHVMFDFASGQGQVGSGAGTGDGDGMG
jgi:hypothetical protein